MSTVNEIKEILKRHLSQGESRYIPEKDLDQLAGELDSLVCDELFEQSRLNEMKLAREAK